MLPGDELGACASCARNGRTTFAPIRVGPGTLLLRQTSNDGNNAALSGACRVTGMGLAIGKTSANCAEVDLIKAKV